MNGILAQLVGVVLGNPSASGRWGPQCARWLLGGLLLRLLAMPFFMHTDYRFVGDIVAYFQVAVSLFSPTGEHVAELPYPPLAYHVAAAFAWLVQPLMGHFPGPEIQGQAAWDWWFDDPLIFRRLFLLKSLYLPFDLATAFLLLRLPKERAHGGLAFRLWMANPVVIYTCYVHGQFDIIPTFFAMGALYLVSRRHVGGAALCLGIVASLKWFSFALMPFLALTQRSLRKAAGVLALGILPYIVTVLAGGLLGQRTTTGAYFVQQFPSLTLTIGQGQAVLVALAIYPFVLLVARERLAADPSEMLWRGGLAALLVFYGVSVYNPQFLTWAMPFVVLHLVADRRCALAYALWLASAIGLTLPLGRPVGFGLLAPVGPVAFLALPSPLEVAGGLVDPALPVLVARSVFAGACAYLVYRLLWRRASEERDETGAGTGGGGTT